MRVPKPRRIKCLSSIAVVYCTRYLFYIDLCSAFKRLQGVDVPYFELVVYRVMITTPLGVSSDMSVLVPKMDDGDLWGKQPSQLYPSQ